MWELVALPPGKKPLTSKWVFRTKVDGDGTSSEKARIIARGFEQVQGIDFQEIFAPMICNKSLHTLLAIEACQDLEIHQLDLKTAFLNGTLKEDVYMVQPKGFENPMFPHLVCKLHKTLYGLRQAPREWYEEIKLTFGSMGLISNAYDGAVFIGKIDEMVVIIGLYVDDMLVMAKTLSAVNQAKKLIASHYDIKDLGEVKFILGMRVSRNREKREITISQAEYIDKIVSKFDMSTAKPISLPIKRNLNLWPRENVSAAELDHLSLLPYRQLIGCMMYLMTASRPDIAFALGKLSRYLATYTERHWQAAKDVLRYLKGTRDISLTYNGRNGVIAWGMADSDFIDHDEDAKSTMGYIITVVAGGAVAWQSTLQSITAKSTAEVEYMAVGEAASDIVWLRGFLGELGFAQSCATVLEEDNQPCMAIALNDVQHFKTKHIKKEYHFIRDYIKNKELIMQYVPSAEQGADAMTKPPTKQTLQLLYRKAGLTVPNGQEC